MCNQSYGKFMFSKIVAFLNLNTNGHDGKIKNENNRDKHNGSSRSNKLWQSRSCNWAVKESSYGPCSEYLEVHGIRAGKKSQVFLYL